MLKFTDWILKHKKIVMAIIIAIDLFSVFIVFTRFSISTDLIQSFGKGFAPNRQFERISSKYNSNGTIMVGIVKNNITSEKNLIEVYNYTKELRKIPGIYYVRSFLPDKFLKSLVFIDVNPTTIHEQYADIISFMKKINSDMFKDNSGIVFVSLKKDINLISTISSIINLSKKYGYNVHLSGNKVMSYYMFKYLIFIVLVLIPLVIIVLLTIFNIALGNMKSALLSLLPAGMAALWTFGFIFLTSQSLSIMTIIVPMFVIIMGSADGLHITSHFISVSSKNEDKYLAVLKTMDMVGLSVILTTITTILGFMSMTFTSLEFLKQMGFYTSVGIGFAGIISWTFLPIILSGTNLGKIRNKKVNQSFLIKFFVFSIRKKGIILLLLTITIVFFSIFIFQLKVEYSTKDLFKPYTTVIRDMDFFNENYGFSNVDMIDYKGNSKSIFDSQLKNNILHFEKELLSINGVKKVTSFMDIENNVKSALNNPLMEKFIIQRMINEKIIPIDQWIHSNKDYKILLQLSNSDSNTIKSIEKLIKKYPMATFTGPDYVFYKLNQMVVYVQIGSLLTAVILVFILMIFIYKNILTALKSILPILYTLVLFFGFLKLSNFNLNIIVADVSSIAIGIGIDYSIHFMGAYKYFKGNVKKTIENVGIPIIANAAGLSFGLAVLLLSPLKVHLYVSLSIIFTMAVSSIATLLILPLILKDSSNEDFD